ncbi:hypothetical protein GCM10025298_00320 [Natronobiforma cellulositropha]
MTAALSPLASATATATATAGDSSEPRVVTYYSGWSRYTREYFPEDVPLGAVTDLNYAFLTVASDGTVEYVDEWGDQENLAAFRELKADYPETNYYLSIGGWTESTYFSDAAATAETRERFAETAIEFLREYEFDGIDIDWEYPGGGGQAGNVTRPEDPENYVLLLEELRAQLDGAETADETEYAITMAASASPATAGNLLIEEIEPYLEYVTVMTYDFAGEWSTETGHNAPLYGEEFSVEASMRWWADQPISREKLLVGLPFYGRAFEDVPADDDGFGQPFTAAASILYDELRERYDLESRSDTDAVTYGWDEAAAAPWLYDADEETFVSYDDPDSIGLTVEYALEEGFGGVMCWEQAGDPDGDLLAVVTGRLAGGVGGPDLDVTGDGNPAQDLTGDGLYEDITGDGQLGFADVVEFFEHHDGGVIQGNVASFDFSGNGRVGFDDVVALFGRV